MLKYIQNTMPLEKAVQYRKRDSFIMKKDLLNKDVDSLYEAILNLENMEECRAFFKDLCTYQELDAMAQRLQVAKMLYTHHVFTDIVAATGASTATISRVNRSIKNGEEGYKAVFERLGIHSGDEEK